MGRAFDTITDQMRSFIAEQHMFFVGTAPQSDGNVNLSPKGYDAFRIIDERTVCYLDLTGSGAETIAHIRENGRITFMFCAFTGKPNIVRLYGTGSVVRKGDAEWANLSTLFPDAPGTRSIITTDIHRTSTACGYSVPFMDFVDDRQRLNKHWEDKTPDDMTAYWAKKNGTSIDGLPAVT
jgi:hypothetical protein